MRSALFYRLLPILALATCPSLAVFAQPVVEVTIVAKGLTNPTGIAVRPGGGRTGNDLFIADSGARRIVSTLSSGDGELSEVITGFSDEDTVGGLLFLSRNTLLVSGGGIVRGYDVSAEELPINSGETKMQSSLVDDETGQLFGMARNSSAVFVTTSGKVEFEGVLRATVSATKLSSLTQFVDTRKATGGSNPRGIAFSKKGYLVVSQAGAGDKPGGSRLGFYHPYDQTAPPALVLQTGLGHIVAIAYSPKTGDLFAADSNSEKSGIYRIDAARDDETGQMGCKAVLIAKVDKPAALAFKSDGTLFVILAGEEPGEGEVIKLDGEF